MFWWSFRPTFRLFHDIPILEVVEAEVEVVLHHLVVVARESHALRACESLEDREEKILLKY